MSEEALMVMKMVSEGKLTPEQGVEFLKAVGQGAPSVGQPQTPQTPETPQNGTHTWGSVDHMRAAMADMQQKLAEAQARLSAAEAQRNTGGQSSNRPGFELPFGLGVNIPVIIDEAMKGLSAVKSEVLIGAKSAARQAQREARRIKRGSLRGHDFNFDVRINVGDEGPQFKSDPAHKSQSESSFAMSETPTFTIANEYGDVRVSGISTDGQVHVTIFKGSWALAEDVATGEMDIIKVVDDTESDGSHTLSVKIGESEQPTRRLSADLVVTAPVGSNVSVITNRGDIVCEKLGSDDMPGSVGTLEANVGDIVVMQVRGSQSAQPAKLYSNSGDISLTQWTGGDISVNTHSGSINFDLTNGANCDLRSKSGEIGIKSLKASGLVFAEAHSGDVTLSDLEVSGPLRAKSMSGEVTGKNLNAGEISMESASGDVKIEQCRVPDSKVTIVSISGGVSLAETDAKEVIAKSTSGDCTLRLGRAVPVSASSVSGNVKVYIPADSSGSVSLNTVSGGAKSEFDLVDGETSKRFVSGRFGAATDPESLPKLSLHSVSGDAQLKKS